MGATTQRFSARIVGVLSGAALLFLAACGESSEPSSSFKETGSKGKDSLAKPTLSVASPAKNATDVRTSAEITFNSNDDVTDVTLTAPAGEPVAGEFRTDKKTWVPGTQLAYNTTYTVNAKTKRGAEAASTFTTSTTKPSRATTSGADLNIRRDTEETVGIGFTPVVNFWDAIPEEKRAEVEKRMFVKTTPQIEGSWYWFGGDSTQVHWRPKEYWKTGTKVEVRLALGGMDLGNGYLGREDRFGLFTVGSAVISTVDNATKTMTVNVDGVDQRSFPISLGRPKFPTSSGTHLVIEKKRSAVFDSSTYGLPVDSPDGYRTRVNWAVRYTWGGEYLHSAPWSVADQGVRNVSHGCVNIAPSNAKWIYDLSKKGDIINIKGTEVGVSAGNGWGTWNLTWEQLKAGSALAS